MRSRFNCFLFLALMPQICKQAADAHNSISVNFFAFPVHCSSYLNAFPVNTIIDHFIGMVGSFLLVSKVIHGV